MKLFFKRQKPKHITNDNIVLETSFDDVIIKIKRTEHRPFYDSTWEINIAQHDSTTFKRIACCITRDDDETAENLEKLLRGFGKDISGELIEQLDRRDKIYYD